MACVLILEYHKMDVAKDSYFAQKQSYLKGGKNINIGFHFAFF